MLTRANWAGLIPHTGRMDVLDRVLHWDDECLQAEAMAPDATHPLARAGRVHAVHLCEYGAQAAAVHGALLARNAHRVAPTGLLAALRAVRLHGQWIDTAAPLHIAVRRLAALPEAVQYRFEVAQLGATLAQGQVLIAFGAMP
ncbi:phosphotransferase [Metallibacterium sp.]|uniref:phosphotransferase n=1 Tax=Metallibacterium sp. TaxID=2940281 RepID=UPI0026038DE4|nr:phosphotransferase [Metallibacterium sp.]